MGLLHTGQSQLAKGPHREKMIGEVFAFFNMTEEEKPAHADKGQMDPARCGTSFNASIDTTLFWSDYLKILAHREFHSHDKPDLFRFVLIVHDPFFFFWGIILWPIY